MKQNYILRKMLVVLLVVFGIAFTTNTAYGQTNLTKGKFTADPNATYMAFIKWGGGIEIHEYDATAKKLSLVSENYDQSAKVIADLKAKYTQQLGTNIGANDYNGFGLSQDGKFAYVAISSGELKALKGTALLAVVQYDIEHKTWSVVAEYDDYKDAAPQGDWAYMQMGGYDPITHSFVMAQPNRNLVDGQPRIDFWALDVKTRKMTSLGYMNPDNLLADLGNPSAGDRITFNGDLCVYSDGTMRLVGVAKAPNDPHVYIYEVAYDEMKKAYAENSANHKLVNKKIFRSGSVQSAGIGGIVIDTNGNVRLTSGYKVYSLAYEEGNGGTGTMIEEIDLRNSPINPGGGKWRDSATVPGRALMVHYVDEDGNYIAPDEFAMINMLNGVAYNTNEAPDLTTCTNRHQMVGCTNKNYEYPLIETTTKWYELIPNRFGRRINGEPSDPEVGQVVDRNFEVTYVYKEIYSKGTDEATKDIQGVAQKATPTFTNANTTPITISATNPAKLIVGGVELTTNTTPAMKNGAEVGSYTLDPNTGTVTFTPNADFVGTPDPITIQVHDKLGNKVPATYTPTVIPNPVGVDKESGDIQGKTQTGTPEFVSQDAVNAPIDTTIPAKLVKTDGTLANVGELIPAMKDGQQIGTYAIDANGVVTFTPNKDFTGTPDGVTVRRQTVEVCDITGDGHPHRATVEATYTPTVTPVTPVGENETTKGVQGVTQTAIVDFTPGDESVPFEGSDCATKPLLVDPADTTGATETSTVTIAGEGTYTIKEDGTVTFTPEKGFVGEGTKITVVATDKNCTKATGSYQPFVEAVKPTAKDVTSIDIQGQEQHGTPLFNEGHEDVPIDTTKPATFVDADGNPIADTTIDAKDKDGKKIGEYTLNTATGEVTFTPNKDFIGTPKPARVQRQDTQGNKAIGTYTPTVTPVKPEGTPKETVDVQGATQTGKPEFKADTRVPMDDTVDATFEDGSTTKTIAGEGTYTVAPDGTVTFVPDPQFTGRATGVTVVRQDTNGTKATATYTPTVTAITPVGEPKQTTDIQGATQTETPTFKNGDANSTPLTPSADNPATFVDAEGNPITATTIDAVKDGKKVGEYSINPETGEVTFTPNKDFVGTPDPAIVQVKDKNGTPATATYTPTVTPVTPTAVDKETTDIQGKTQTGAPTFVAGDKRVPMDDTVPAKLIDKDGNEVDSIKIEEEGTYSIDPTTGEVTFEPEPTFVGTAKGVTVVRQDTNGTKASAKYIPTVIPVTPTGAPKETTDIQGKTQKGTPTFTAGHPDVPIDTTVPAKLKGANEEGKVVVPNEGTYSIDPTTGEVTFVPEKDFVGKATGVTVIRQDENGTPAEATYTPTVTPVTPTGEDEVTKGKQGEQQSAKVDFTAGDKDVPMDDTVPAKFIDPETGKEVTSVTIAGEGTYTIESDGTVTFTPEPSFIGKGTKLTVVRVDVNGTKAEGSYEAIVESVTPTAKDATSVNIQGKEQTGTPEFTGGDANITIDKNVPAIFSDKDGNPIAVTNDANGNPTVPAKDKDGNTIGTYTLDPATGTVKFQPNPDFVGTPLPVYVKRVDTNKTPAIGSYTPEVLPVTPKGTPKETSGLQGKEQSAEIVFTAGHADVPMKDPATAPMKIKDADGNLVDTLETPQGTYTVAEDGKTIKFQPKPEFIGTADGVTVVREDINGTPAETTYTPTVTPVKPTAAPDETTGPQGVTQTGKVVFTAGSEDVPMDDTVPATFEDGTTTKTVDGVGTYTVAKDGTVTFEPEPTYVGTAQGVTVVRQDVNGTKAKATYVPTVTAVAPTATPAQTTGVQGAEQNGKPVFTAGDKDVPMDDTVPAKLKDENGNEVDSITIPNEGTYTVAEDGTVTFMPEPDYIGEGTGVTVVRQDINGTKAEAKYTPTVTPVIPTAVNKETSDIQGKTQKGAPTFIAGSAGVPMDGNVPAKLIDPKTGNKVDSVTVDGVGTYTVASDGTVTFVPLPSFVGETQGVEVVRVDKNGTEAKAKYIPTVTAVKPTGDHKTTMDIQGKEQSAQVEFTEGSKDVPMDDAVPATFEDGSTTKTIKGEGTYTVAKDGTVTFTPEPSFVGAGTKLVVVRVDKNGTPAKGSYQAIVTPVKPTAENATSVDMQGVKQTGTPVFKGADENVPMDNNVPATFEDGSTTKTIEGQGTYTVAKDGTVTFDPEKTFTGTATPVKVVRQDTNGTKVRATYTPTVLPVKPTGTPKETSGVQGVPQSGKVEFTAGDTKVPMKDPAKSPATFKDGSTTKTIPNEGTYTVAPDGTVTFTPEKDFVGEGTGVIVVREDINGTKAEAKYTPTVTGVVPTGEVKETTGLQGETQTGKVEFTPGAENVPMKDPSMLPPATFGDGTTEKVVAGEGTYTVAPDGTVTFKPEPTFVGTAKGVTVVREDVNGTKATGKYIPTVVADMKTKWVKEGTNEPLKDPVVAKAFQDGVEEIDVIEVIDGKKQIVTYYKKDTVEANGVRTHIYAKKKTDYQFEDGTQAPIDDVEGSYENYKEGDIIKGTDGYNYEVVSWIDPVRGVKVIKVKRVLVTTQWVDEDGNPIPGYDKVTDKEGKPKKNIDGYTYITTTTDENGNVTHFYHKNTSCEVVTTEWVDEDGNPIPGYDKATGPKAEPKKDIEGYEFIRTDIDKDGNAKHFYKKINVCGDVVTTFVEEGTGKTLLPAEKGAKSSKDIEGYELVDTVIDSKRNIKYVYREIKKPEEKEITITWVDTDGNELKTPEISTKPIKHGTITGYEFVDMVVDKEGNVKYIFKSNCTSLLKNIVVPQLVTPNGDGNNEEWIIEGLRAIDCPNTVKIFNRWGAKVFEQENYMKEGRVFAGYSSNSLDLKDGKKLPAGTYFYIIESGDFKKSGYIYVIYE